MSYFLRVREETPTRFWVNNPTLAESDAAIAQGAVACTTNPTFVGSLLQRMPDEAMPTIERLATREHDDDDTLASRVQREVAAPLCDRFQPLFESSAGREGLVTIQGSPEADTRADAIIEDALLTREVALNATPKIPATVPGLVAMEALVAEGHPIVMTEVFSLAQLADIAARYERVTTRTGTRPVLYVAAITGIFGDRLRVVARERGTDVPEAVITMAGIAFARRCHAEVEAHRYPFTLLFGGARTSADFTGLVGAADHNTINYSTAAEILAVDPPVEQTIDAPVAPETLDVLSGFDEFRRAMEPDGLAPEEFEAFGPVQHFRNNFIAGWSTLLAAIGDARQRRQVEVAP